jgi:hypothetical protein
MLAALAGFQSWDGIYSFAYCHNADFEPRRVGSYFDMKSNTAQLVHLPACAALFTRGDVAPARQTVLAAVPEDAQRGRLRESGDPWQLNTGTFGVDPQTSLLHCIAMQLTPAEAQSAADAVQEQADTPTRFVCDTGQLVWDVSDANAGFFTVDTPRTKLFTGFVRDRPFALGDVQIRIGKTRNDWATVSMVCIDGEGFDDSGRILIAATGAMRNQGAQSQGLGEGRVTLGRNWGTEPVMCEGVPATVSLPVSAERVTLYPLDEAGNRRSAIGVENRDRQAELVLSADHKTAWYEVVVD